jgi:ribosomal protein L37E
MISPTPSRKNGKVADRDSETNRRQQVHEKDNPMTPPTYNAMDGAPQQPFPLPREFPGMVFCRGCGGRVHEKALMCPHCGYNEQQKDLQRCWRCGREVHVSAAQCLHCGYTGEKPAKNAVPWAYIGAVLLPIVGAGLGIYLLVKERFGHGMLTILLSVFMMQFLVGIFVSL